jgi:hypothetical protein
MGIIKIEILKIILIKSITVHEQNTFLKEQNIDVYTEIYFNFWKDIKCTRGDSDAYYNYRTEEYFKNFDINELDDYRLSEQNKNLFI